MYFKIRLSFNYLYEFVYIRDLKMILVVVGKVKVRRDKEVEGACLEGGSLPQSFPGGSLGSLLAFLLWWQVFCALFGGSVLLFYFPVVVFSSVSRDLLFFCFWCFFGGSRGFCVRLFCRAGGGTFGL